jgi:hypothetical protein
MRNYYTSMGLEVSHGMRFEDLSSELWCPMILTSFLEKGLSPFSAAALKQTEQVHRITESSVSQNTPCPIPQEGNPRGVNLPWLLWSVRNYFWVGITESYFYVAPTSERPLILFILFRYNFYLRITHFSVKLGIDCLINVLVKHS